MRPRRIGRKLGEQLDPRRRAGRRRAAKPRASTAWRRLRDMRRRILAEPDRWPIRFAARRRLRASRCRCSPATTSPTTPAPASCTPRPATARRLRDLDEPSRLRRAGIDTDDPLHRRRRRLFHQRCAVGFAGKRVIDDKGKKGDANEAVIEALIEAGALLARGRLQAHLSAFLALQGAGDLPQHAAMVRRHGQAARRRHGEPRTRPSASARSTAIDATRLVPPQGREPPARHDRGRGPTGCCRASAPGACRSPSSSTRTTGEVILNATKRSNDPHHRGLRGRGRRRLVRGGRQGSASCGLVDDPSN